VSIDPVLVRELRLSARNPLIYVLRVMAVAALAGVVWNAAQTGPLVSALASVSEYAALGRELFRGVSWILFTFATLSALAAAAESVVREARAGTLGLLSLTPLGERRLLKGKWRAAMTQSVLAVLTASPALAACAYLGGVNAWHVATAVLTALGSASLAAAFGLRASVQAEAAGPALVKGAVLYAGWALVPLLLSIPTAGIGLFAGVFGHPFYAAWVIDDTRRTGDGIEISALSSLVVSLLFCAQSLAGSAAKLAMRVKEIPDPEFPDPLYEPIPSRSFLSWIPGWTRRGEVWDRAPQLWKDLATRPAARMPLGGRFLVFVVVPTACYFLLLADQGRNLSAFAALGVLFAGSALLAGASLFAPERRRRTLDLLLASPLPASRVVGAKLLSGPAAPEALLLLVFFVFAVLVYGARCAHPAGPALFAAVSVLFLATAYLAGAAASLVSSGPGSAFVRAASVLGLLLVLFPGVFSPLPALEAVRSGDAPRVAARTCAVYLGLLAVLGGFLVGRLRR
jgi:ABC-type transport system involved in multi-copper enzyme maturation permease subunit